MEWYGESLDIIPTKSKSLPQYVEPSEIEHLIDVIRNKKTHKRTVVRDILLIRFATMTVKLGQLILVQPVARPQPLST